MKAVRQKAFTALVAGASGLVGGALVDRLRASGDYRYIHLLCRRALGMQSDRVGEHLVDFERLEDASDAISRVDHAFCCLGTTIRKAGSQAAFRRVDHDYVLAFGRLAADLGARSLVVVSSLGADPDSRNFYLRVKGETERDLRQLDLASLVIVRPSLLTGDRREFRPAERLGAVLLAAVSPFMIGPMQRVRPVSASRVAETMQQAAREENAGVRIIESEQIQRGADSA